MLLFGANRLTVPIMRQQFASSFGTGLGATLGILAALALGVAALRYGDWLESPVPTRQRPAQTTGTAEQAKSAALSALQKRGVRNLAKECKATFLADNSQWVVRGPATTDDSKLIQVSVVLSVGTVNGTRHWKAEYMEVDGREYLGK